MDVVNLPAGSKLALKENAGTKGLQAFQRIVIKGKKRSIESPVTENSVPEWLLWEFTLERRLKSSVLNMVHSAFSKSMAALSALTLQQVTKS